MYIQQVFEEYLQNEFNRERKSSRKFYVSDMGKCLRTRYLKRLGVESTFETYVLWLMQAGNLAHDYLYKILEGRGLLLESEDYVSDDHFIGKYDGVMNYMKQVKKETHTVKRLFDGKLTNPYKITKIKGGDDDEWNTAQILTYLIMLRDDGRTDLDDTASLFYINKDPGAKNPFTGYEREVHLTKWREKKIREEKEKLVSYWTDKKLPPCTCPAWMKRGDYNNYSGFCNSDELQVKEWAKHLEDGYKVITTKEFIIAQKEDEEKSLWTK